MSSYSILYRNVFTLTPSTVENIPLYPALIIPLIRKSVHFLFLNRTHRRPLSETAQPQTPSKSLSFSPSNTLSLCTHIYTYTHVPITAKTYRGSYRALVPLNFSHSLAPRVHIRSSTRDVSNSSSSREQHTYTPTRTRLQRTDGRHIGLTANTRSGASCRKLRTAREREVLPYTRT